MKVTLSCQEKECLTESCKRYAERLQRSLDECVDPCDDFSSFVCGNFEESHKIPIGQTSASTFDDIEDDITFELKHLLESQGLDNESLPQTKASEYYRSCLNMDQRNKSSKKSILEFVEKLNNETEYFQKLRKLVKSGISSRIVSFAAEQDSKNPQFYILNIGKANLILSETTLQSSEEQDVKQLNNYKKYMNKVLDLLELWKDDRSMVDKVVNLNIKVAKSLPTIIEQQNPDKYYNKVSIGDLEKSCEHIPWKIYINELLEGTLTKLTEHDNVVIFSLGYIDNICNILNTYKTEVSFKGVLEKDLEWAAISSLIQYGSEELVAAYDELNREMLGVVGKEELWKTCVEETSSTMNDIVGNMYVKGNFDCEKKMDAEEMLLNVKKVLKEVIEEINWMDDETKNTALLKLKSIRQKIGYSEKILNETQLAEDFIKIKINVEQYIKNHIALKEAEFIKSMEGIGAKSPEDKWFMGPQQVNAYYNPPSNEIVFPAAIFRFPFYDIDFPITLNYGGIGTFIGHEILHGFDSSGSKYDDKGLLREWWTTETRKRYNEKAQCIIDQYGNYTMYGKKLQSEQTIAEDIADNAGIRMAFKGSQISVREKTILPGLNYTSQQLFFINQAMTWCSVFTKESLLEKMRTDEHTIWSFRINGPLSNMPEFTQAFNCNHDQKMNRHKKCVVW